MEQLQNPDRRVGHNLLLPCFLAVSLMLASCQKRAETGSRLEHDEIESLMVKWREVYTKPQRVANSNEYSHLLHNISNELRMNNNTWEVVVRNQLVTHSPANSKDLFSNTSPLIKGAGRTTIAPVGYLARTLVNSIFEKSAQGKHEECIANAHFLGWIISGLRKERYVSCHMAALSVEKELAREYKQHSHLLNSNERLEELIRSIFEGLSVKDEIRFVGMGVLTTIRPLNPDKHEDIPLYQIVCEFSSELLNFYHSERIQRVDLVETIMEFKGRLKLADDTPLREVLTFYIKILEEEMHLNEKRREVGAGSQGQPLR